MMQSLHRLFPRNRLQIYMTLGILSPLALGGCYTYQSLESEPMPRTEVRVRLTGTGQDELLRDRGLSLERIEGRLVEVGEERMALEVNLGANRSIYAATDLQGPLLDTLVFSRSNLRDVDVRSFSAGRTVLLSAIGIAGVASAYSIAVSSSGDGTSSGDDGGSFLFSIAVPFGRLAATAASLFR